MNIKRNIKYLLAALLLSTNFVQAQVVDSTATDTLGFSKQLKLKMLYKMQKENKILNDSVSALNAQLKARNSECDTLKQKIINQAIQIQSCKDEVQQKEDTIVFLNSEVARCKEQMKEKDSVTNEMSKNLIITAVTFLDIPYDQYCIDKIALPAFQYADSTRRQKYAIYYEALKNYQSHVKELLQWLNSKEVKKMNSLNVGDRLVEFTNRDIYKVYVEKGGGQLENTWLYKKVTEIEKQLKEFNENRHKEVDFSQIKNDLEHCL